MTDTELNKKVHRLIGRCWHEFVPSDDNLEWVCEHCSKLDTEILNSSINLLTWEGFGIAWEWLQKHERWEDFIANVLNQHPYSVKYISGTSEMYSVMSILNALISPRALSEAMVEFFKEAK